MRLRLDLTWDLNFCLTISFTVGMLHKDYFTQSSSNIQYLYDPSIHTTSFSISSKQRREFLSFTDIIWTSSWQFEGQNVWYFGIWVFLQKCKIKQAELKMKFYFLFWIIHTAETNKCKEWKVPEKGISINQTARNSKTQYGT